MNEILKGIAGNLPDMVGGRMLEELCPMGTDMSGQLVIDLLTGTVRHSTLGQVKLNLAHELSLWMQARLETSKIPIQLIETATLTVGVDVHKTSAGGAIDFTATSILKSQGHTYGRTAKGRQAYIHMKDG